MNSVGLNSQLNSNSRILEGHELDEVINQVIQIYIDNGGSIVTDQDVINNRLAQIPFDVQNNSRLNVDCDCYHSGLLDLGDGWEVTVIDCWCSDGSVCS